MKIYSLSLLIISTVFLFSGCSKTSDASSSSSGNSTGGSMARFTLVGNYLYTINSQSLKTFNVTNPASPVLESIVSVGSNIETIFPFKGNLFIGSNQTMYAYSLNNPAKPEKLSQTAYVILFTGHDPVVVNDTLAYSTVRTSTGGFGSVLNVVDIRNIKSPGILNRLPMISPYGLGLADTALYICEHVAGLEVYSLKTNAANPILRKTINDGETYYDVIPAGNLLYTWIENGNSIFNITNRMNPVQLSKTKN